MAEINVYPGASSDDCLRCLTYGGSDYWGLTYPFYIVGSNVSDYYQFGVGMRFPGVTIPQGSTITAASIRFYCTESASGVTVNTRISAEDVDNAVTFADDKAAFDTRWAARTTTRVDWDNIPAWTIANYYTTPEIKTVIQEIVDRVGWSSGNAIVIFWDDFEDRSTHGSGRYRHANGYDNSSSETYLAKLHIEYTVPGAAGRSYGFIIG